MANKPIEDEILNEAQGARRTSQEILALMQEPADDPIQVMLAMLRDIGIQQNLMLSKLEIMERTLLNLTKRQDASPG